MRTKDKSIREIQHHLENTAWILIKVYNKKQLAKMDWTTSMMIDKRPNKYLPVRLDNKHMSRRFYTPWQKANRPYSIGYIRVDEFIGLFKKKTWKNLIAY